VLAPNYLLMTLIRVSVTWGVTDMSVKPCENYKMIMVNYVDLWLVHTQGASELKGAK
jgi:hypothetical protein